MYGSFQTYYETVLLQPRTHFEVSTIGSLQSLPTGFSRVCGWSRLRRWLCAPSSGRRLILDCRGNYCPEFLP
jgi:hypothetical protein